MRESRQAPERLDLATADDPRDVIHRVVACLAQGGVVALPCGATTALVASALHPAAVEKLRVIEGAAEGRPLSLSVRGPGELADWVPGVSSEACRLATRAWPGPLTLIVRGGVSAGLCESLPASVRTAVASDSSVGFRMPAHGAFREIQGLLSGPLVLADVIGSGDELAGHPDLDMIVADRPPPRAECDTVVRFDRAEWSILREGGISRKEIARGMSMLTLFVCTGNTCRSPMAEALARLILAERLGCRADELEARGYTVASAGLAAARGARAAADALNVVHERGGSLRDHVSRQLTEPMVLGADLIVAMTRDHRDAILDEFPETAPKVRLLDPGGGDIDDPIGSDLPTYRQTATIIESFLRTLWDDVIPLRTSPS